MSPYFYTFMGSINRTRVRSKLQSLTNQNGHNFFPPGYAVYEQIDEAPKGTVTHFKVRPYTGYYYVGNNGVDKTLCTDCVYVETFGSYQAMFLAAIANCGFPPPGLNRKKLPSSNEFGLIQFFAEFDETMELFSKRFWKAMNYGKLTWGILPLIGELEALIKAYDQRLAAYDTKHYEDTLSLSKEVTLSFWPGSLVDITVVYERRYSGTLSWGIDREGSFGKALDLLDRIGFHPDAGTAYDLIPYSFVVDYFVPLGQMINSIRSPGWVNNLNFSGFCSEKYSFTAYPRSIPTGKYEWYTAGTLYKRARFVDTILPNQGAIITAPELGPLQLFNTFWLEANSKR